MLRRYSSVRTYLSTASLTLSTRSTRPLTQRHNHAYTSSFNLRNESTHPHPPTHTGVFFKTDRGKWKWKIEWTPGEPMSGSGKTEKVCMTVALKGVSKANSFGFLVLF